MIGGTRETVPSANPLQILEKNAKIRGVAPGGRRAMPFGGFIEVPKVFLSAKFHRPEANTLAGNRGESWTYQAL
mgnify:CR=1 FL=1